MSFVRVLIVLLLALYLGSFTLEAMAEEPAKIGTKQSILSAECRRSVMQKKVQFLDKNGDGLNDLLQDSDGDGIPDGRICNGSGYYGAGRGGFYWQGGGGMMKNGTGNSGSGRGYGCGFRHGGGRR